MLMRRKCKNSCTALWVLGALFLAGCADGYDAPNGFDLGVRNTQMETPIQDSISFKVATDGKTATVSWPTVAGADGHEVTFKNVDDPENPVVLYDGIVDGSKFTVPVTEDSKYHMTMRTLGNKKLGNTDANETKEYDFTTLVRSVMTIPSGEEISAYIAAHPLDSIDEEVAIDLEPKGEYTFESGIDFGPHKLTFRGDKVHRPVVHMVGDGHFETWSTLKVKFINFDMTESTAAGLIAMSKTAPDSIKVENLPGYSGSKLSKGHYMVEDPIYIANCWFKNLPHAMLYDNAMNCAFWYFTVSDCIVQMNNTTKSNIGFINLYSAGKSVKNITIEGSTIFNIADNESACFIRYQNESNSQPEKTFGSTNATYQSQSWKFLNSTLANVYYSKEKNNGWRFCNNVRGNDMTLIIDHTIFYNCTQLYRMTGLGSKTFRFNFFWNDREDDHNRNLSASDSSGAPFASEYDPKFGGDNDANIYKEIDFDQPNGGLNFTPKEYEVLTNRGGDPRWLPAVQNQE